MPSIQIILVEPLTLMAGSEKRGWATDGKFDVSYDHDYNTQNGVEYNVEQQTGDGFLDID